MEKLYSIYEFEPERILKMLQVLKLVQTDVEFDEYSVALQTMRKQFRDPTSRKTIGINTPDPKLKDALRLLEPLFNKFAADVHANNVMVRFNGSKIHLVLSDPIWLK